MNKKKMICVNYIMDSAVSHCIMNIYKGLKIICHIYCCRCFEPRVMSHPIIYKPVPTSPLRRKNKPYKEIDGPYGQFVEME